MQSVLSRLSFGKNGVFRALRVPSSSPSIASTSISQMFFRQMSTVDDTIMKTRNIGISAHIDSGKTTVTERILFYTKRIKAIHEVRGKDGVGAKMDSMELEREKGITIQSAATFCTWGDHKINIIDTPGHVDFTIEVERALRVLDGAVLVLCSVGGVQSQTLTVDRQMKRYGVPRVAFINKCDRSGANPMKVLAQVVDKLHINAVPIQMPIGLEEHHAGVVDLVTMEAVYFSGPNGDEIERKEIPDDLKEEAEDRRSYLIENLSDIDEVLGEKYLNEEPITKDDIVDSIRRMTIALKFTAVCMGSALKNKGVQLLLDNIVSYLPSPYDITNTALDIDNEESTVVLKTDADLPLVALAFKLQENRFGQLTYLRLYQGQLRRGDNIKHVAKDTKIKVPRLVRMHSDEMEDIDSANCGDIVAMFGIECASGDTFTDLKTNYSMESMHVPNAVMSYAIAPKFRSKDSGNFGKALNRFVREDPTFRVGVDEESKETIISGMGELHLQIYVERMKREYGVETIVGQPRVNYRETVRTEGKFDYLHKKQSGGAGQYGRVIGYIEPLEQADAPVEFFNGLVGNNILPEYVAACEKGFMEAAEKGPQLGHPVTGLRVVLKDGATHVVDSSEMAFKTAARMAFKQAMENAKAAVLEPIMSVEIQCPEEFQGQVVGFVNSVQGMINSTENLFSSVVVQCEVPLNRMFGFSSNLRSMTQGKGEFSMEYLRHAPVMENVRLDLMKKHQEEQSKKQTNEM